MNLQQIEQRLAKLIESEDTAGRIIILNYKGDNKLLRFLESIPLARRVNNVFEATAAEVFKNNGATASAIEDLRLRCTPQSGTTFDYDSPSFSTRYTIDYCYIPEDINAIAYLAAAFGKNYVAIVDYSPRLPSLKVEGFEIIEYN